MHRRNVLKLAAATAAGALPGLPMPAIAQSVADFPSKPITLLMGWPPGSGPDIWHRALAEAMSKHLGQAVVVDNKAGASGTLAPASMISAKPDGYTISHMPITVLRLPVMQKVAFDPLKDFTWIVHMSGFQFTTTVRVDSPIKTMKDLIDYAKANPGKVTYGTPGSGTSLHIGMEMIAKHAGVQWTQVPFKGSIESITALEGGHIMVVAGGSEIYPLIEAGKFRSLAVWTEKRLARLPDVPTLKEVGLPFVFNSPYGMAGPKGMDPAIVKKLHDAIKLAMEDPKAIEVRDKFNMVANYMDTPAYAKYQLELYEQEKKYLTDIGLAKKD